MSRVIPLPSEVEEWITVQGLADGKCWYDPAAGICYTVYGFNKFGSSAPDDDELVTEDEHAEAYIRHIWSISQPMPHHILDVVADEIEATDAAGVVAAALQHVANACRRAAARTRGGR